MVCIQGLHFLLRFDLLTRSVYFPDNPQNAEAGGWEHDACHPVLALPPSLLKMQKAWEENGCQALDGYGAYDPPIALTEASYVIKPTLSTKPQPGATTSPDAAPMTTSIAALPAVTAPDSTETVSSTQMSSVAPKPGVNHGDGAASENEAVSVVESVEGASSNVNIGDYIMSGINTVQATQDDNAAFTSSATASLAIPSTESAHSSSAVGPQSTQTSRASATANKPIYWLPLIILAFKICR